MQALAPLCCVHLYLSKVITEWDLTHTTHMQVQHCDEVGVLGDVVHHLVPDAVSQGTPAAPRLTIGEVAQRGQAVLCFSSACW